MDSMRCNSFSSSPSVSHQQSQSITHLYHINSHILSPIYTQQRQYHHHQYLPTTRGMKNWVLLIEEDPLTSRFDDDDDDDAMSSCWCSDLEMDG